MLRQMSPYFGLMAGEFSLKPDGAITGSGRQAKEVKRQPVASNRSTGSFLGPLDEE